MIARSTADSIDRTIISADTVYLRSDIKYVTDEDFEGWEYEETQMSKDEFIGVLLEENMQITARVSLTEKAIDFLIMSGGEI